MYSCPSTSVIRQPRPRSMYIGERSGVVSTRPDRWWAPGMTRSARASHFRDDV